MPRNLHLRLILLVALATIPAMLLVVQISLEQRRSEREDAKADAMNIATTLASQTAFSLETLQELLHAFGSSSLMQSRDGPGCSTVLGQIRANYPAYKDANFFAADNSGWTFCHASGPMEPMFIGDRPYFTRTIGAGNFTVGEYQIGRFTGLPSIVVGEPVYSAGEIVATLFASVPISAINSRTEFVSLPPSVEFTVTDRAGTVIASNDARLIGHRDPNLDVLAAHATDGGLIETADAAGQKRLFSQTPVGDAESTGLRVSVAIPTGVAYAAIDRKLARNLGLLALSALIASTLAWYGTDVFVARGAHNLVNQLRRKAYYDPLTGLANRELMHELLTGVIDDAQGRETRAAVLFIDLDGFKAINDRLGHAQGDGVLRLVARRLERIAGNQNVVARLGGDEFVVLITNVASKQEATDMAERILSLSRSVRFGEEEIHLTASIGVAYFPEHGIEASQLLARADEAMYAAKDAGRNTWMTYGRDDDGGVGDAATQSRRPHISSRPTRAA